jgi:hypothetical protein
MRNHYAAFFFLLFSSCFTVSAQKFGDEWIVFGQPYLKVKVAKEGLYKVSYELLKASMTDDSFLQSDKLQLWHRGVQQSIHVNATNGVLREGDDVLFYGIKNDGWQDSLLYRPATQFYNKYSNLFSDTTAYFLTVSETGPWKRMEVEKAAIEPANCLPKIMGEVKETYFDDYFQKAYDGYDPTQTHFVPGEGWIANGFRTMTKTIAVPYCEQGDSARLEVLGIGRDYNIFAPQFYIQSPDASRKLFLGSEVDSSGQTYGNAIGSYAIDGLHAYLQDEKFSLFVDNTAGGRFGLSNYRVVYSRKADLSTQHSYSFYVASGAPAASLQNVAPKHWILRVSDENNASFVPDSVVSQNAYLPQLVAGEKLFYTTQIDSLHSIEKVRFRDYPVTDSTYVVLTHSKIKKSAGDYAAYRASAFGGGYDTLLVDVKEVMDQYAYGETTPMGIRKFLNRMKSRNIHCPDQLFIIGQGIQLDYLRNSRKDPSQIPYAEDLVIPAGVPGGDFTYSIGLDGTANTNGYGWNAMKYRATVSTGRLQAKTDQMVWDYLAKVKEHEGLRAEEATWRRNVLHLSGGYQFYQSVEYNKSQAALLRSYMDESANFLKAPYMGANVGTIGRSSTESSEFIDISTQVNKGVSMVTFLGHSGRYISDIWIGLVSKGGLPYENKGKYPFLFLNGCRLGDVFIDNEKEFEASIILDWVLTKDKGAIAAYAGAGTNFALYLKFYIQNFYFTAFSDSANLSKTLGEQIVLSHERYTNSYTSVTKPDPISSSMLSNYSLQGDPAVRLFPNPKVDYAIDCDRVELKALNNNKITSQTDSFDIAIPVKNFGMYGRKQFGIGVKRWYANNTKSVYYPPQYFNPVRESDTVYFRVRGAVAEANGSNTFEIIVDPEGQVPELNETNNQCGYTAYLPGTTLLCLYPKKYSIVNSQPVTFVAQSSTITNQEREFYMELDTSYLFKSSFKKSFVTKSVNTPTWQSVLLENEVKKDSMVYYWRARYVQPLSTEDTAYAYSSFIYIKDSPEGWSQSEFPQFFEDEALALKMDSTLGQWIVRKLTASITATVAGRDTVLPHLSYKSAPLIFNNNCRDDGLYILTINPINLKIKQTSIGDDGRYQCDAYTSPLVTKVSGLHDASQRAALFKILDENINHGDYVFIMSMKNAQYSQYEPGLKDLLKTQFGATFLDSLKDGQPYALLARKGFGKLDERYGIGPNVHKQVIDFQSDVTSLGYGGTVASTLIGPATEWGNFFRSYRKNVADSIRFDIAGIDANGKETILLNDVKEDGFGLNLINATQYPYLRLYASKQTPTQAIPQLTRWQVMYRGVPEGTMVYKKDPAIEYETFSKQEGDTSKVLVFRFQNISKTAFEKNVLVRYKIVNETKSANFYDTLKVALMPDSTWEAKFKVPTLGWVGNNKLEVFFNPTPSQKEEYLGNNSYELSYSVFSDKIHPILEVAFDGHRIMNGELVSPTPTISIAVQDENKYLGLKDTTGLTVELKRPCGSANCTFEKIDLNSSEVTFYPTKDNKLELQYKPGRLPDGIYTLRVQAKDASGNQSGTKPYMIQFEVINEVAITNFLPYPNPFSSKMWFVYTLTGDVPDQLRIQILTATGKVVRQLFMEELGLLRIGTHRTDFVWDGTDDFGDQLANGVYIYKVNARKNGEEIKHRNASFDGMFKNGYGKLYILR